MRRTFRCLTQAALLACLASVPTLALAQGSAGGSIGNDEKSLSGSRPEPRSVEPDRPARHGKSDDAESRRTPSRSGGGGGGNFDGAWAVLSVGTTANCQGTSSSAVVVSSGKIIGQGIVSGHVSPNGAASAVGSSNGVTIVSSGHLSGRSGSGTFRRSDGCIGRWTASKQ